MPLSANSPTGPFSLLGLDALTLEHLKERNRREHLFSAKCCGAPVQIRTPARKVPHFYHLATTPDCSGGGRESHDHLALKAEIGAAAMEAGWEAEAEAAFRNPDGALIWKADVLAIRRNVRIAFEVQLSHPDWHSMHERQLRYKATGVRGLWFVKTSKPFPQQTAKALPVFRVSKTEGGWVVHLAAALDWDIVWGKCSESVSLALFVVRALGGRLQWAPEATKWRTRRATVEVRMQAYGKCRSCGCDLGRPYALTLDLEGQEPYPTFAWHQGMRGSRRTAWSVVLAETVSRALGPASKFAFLDTKNNVCGSCGADARRLDDGLHFPVLTASVALQDLSEPQPATIEWDWLHRWVLR
jgi:hypothetical protein